MIVSIGSITIELVFARQFERTSSLLKTHLQSYIQPLQCSAIFKIHIAASKNRSVGRFNRKSHSFYAAKNYWVIIQTGLRCTISWEKNWAILQFFGDEEQLFFSTLDMLKLIIACKVIKKGGLPLHCSAIERNSIAVIFFGPSGIGKTTIAGLLTPNWRILNDEFNILLPGPMNTWVVWSTPFTKLEHIGMCTNTNGQVKALFSLRQHNCNEIAGIALQQIIFKLFACVYTIPTTDELGTAMLDTLYRLAQSDIIQRLSFVNNDNINADLETFIDH